MQACLPHWEMCREAIKERGLDGLVSKNGEELADRLVDETKHGHDLDNFDPLMSLYMHFMNEALRSGGLYLLGPKEGGGDYCPFCEFEIHAHGFDSKRDIGIVADQIQSYCRKNKLIPAEQ